MPLLFGNTAASGMGGNYFGSSADGAVTYATNTNLTVPNKNGSYDGDMVVMNYSSLTINSGVTLTTDQPGRGLLIYVNGDCTINGTLSMTGRGAYANPTVSGASDGNAVSSSGLQFPFLTATGSALTPSASLLNGCGTAARAAIALHPAGVGQYLTVPRIGGAGATAAYASSGANAAGNVGGTISGGTGGGGGGGTRTGYAGGGAAGTCFTGGSGGGGNHYSGSTGFDTVANCSGAAWGGPGGPGYNGTGANEGDGGGAGNGGGLAGYTASTGANFNNSTNGKGEDGTGGLLILIVKGTLTVGASGSIQAKGKNGGIGTGWAAGSGGGGSGGGAILLAYKGGYANNGSVTAAGGLGALQFNTNWNPSSGADGGVGSIQTLQVL